MSDLYLEWSIGPGFTMRVSHKVYAACKTDATAAYRRFVPFQI